MERSCHTKSCNTCRPNTLPAILSAAAAALRVETQTTLASRGRLARKEVLAPTKNACACATTGFGGNASAI
eukprot:7325532-Lingulodinium_polyedra.AAC.1